MNPPHPPPLPRQKGTKNPDALVLITNFAGTTAPANESLWICTDSAPSKPDDSHAALNCMPKNRFTGHLIFRRLPLSLPVSCACRIQKSTPEKRNLYLSYYFYAKIITLYTGTVNGFIPKP
jgi:hypothetical protein